MRIDGVTTCVGPIYAAALRRTLPRWLDTLDSVTVVTCTYNCGVAIFEAMRETCRLFGTDAFTAGGAHFNKGAALNEGIAAAAPNDWILSFDCDTLPPREWRELAEPILQPGNLYGCIRRIRRLYFKPYGYFQLWHTSDPLAAPFPECYGHAGRYDHEFMERWPQERRIALPSRVVDIVKGSHWFGPGKDHLMQDLLRGGVQEYRRRNEKLPRRR